MQQTGAKEGSSEVTLMLDNQITPAATRIGGLIVECSMLGTAHVVSAHAGCLATPRNASLVAGIGLP